MTLDHPSTVDITWWVNTLPSACAPVTRGPCSAIFTCDASEKGWSACFNGQKANGQFSDLELPHSTNTKEIVAVFFGLKCFWTHLQNQHILIMSDSTTAIGVVKKMGSMDNIVHDDLAREIWHFAESKGIWLTITHIPGRANYESDEGSRVFYNENTEWTMPQCLFDRIVHHFRGYGPVVIDLFASRLNFKIKPYCSFGPDPFSSHIDCFTTLWDNPYIHYCYPPFSVLHRVLQKMDEDQAKILLVFPFWPTQMWFTRMLERLMSPIVVLPTSPPVYLPWDLRRTHPLGARVRLCTALLSGKPSDRTIFHRSLLNSSSAPKHHNNRLL